MDSHIYDTFASDLDGWRDLDPNDSFGAELADCEAELDEFGQQAVQSYWDKVIAEELGASALPVAPFVWSELGSGERTRPRRYDRREAGAELRLITAEADAVSDSGEAA